MPIEHGSEQHSLIHFSSEWEVLGPFQIGTREASWGADPLEPLGGFRALRYDAKTVFPSSLASNGLVSWSTQPLETSTKYSSAAEAVLTIAFPNVDWKFLQSIYGWAALQYQAWARGHIDVAPGSCQPMVLFIDNVLEFWVDENHYFGGDFYGYRRAPVVVQLLPGRHKLDIRLIRDVRAMDGIGSPKISISMRAEAASNGLAIASHRLLASNVVNGRLASEFASVPVRNDSKDSIEITSITSQATTIAISSLDNPPFRLVPGQSRPFGFRILSRGPFPPAVNMTVTYVRKGNPEYLLSGTFSHTFLSKDIHSPHKFTFLHPSGIVSYAIIRAPSKKVCSEADSKTELPVLLNLHGAGLEADSQQVRHMLDGVPDLPSWVLFPTGVTPWSGDDWHIWGFADVEAGTAAIKEWIKCARWGGPSVDLSRWLVSGHSNGGQGAWYALTHRPDKIIGAVPVSGYSSIQGYVPYHMWKEADPRVISLIQNSLQNFRHELLVGNSAGVPVVVQHGGADDNVPAFHSRRMHQLISQSPDAAAATYIELDGKGHWFDGVMSTTPLRTFYADVLGGAPGRPALPLKFSIAITNAADMGPRGDLVVDQLSVPDQLGKIDVSRSPALASWTIKTSNVRRFHLSPNDSVALPLELVIDDNRITLPASGETVNCWFLRSRGGVWQISYDNGWLSKERHSTQLGPLDSILRTPRRFLIRCQSAETLKVALQVSRNLFQYFSADQEIVDTTDGARAEHGNIISIAKGEEFPSSADDSVFPIQIIKGRGVCVRSPGGPETVFEFQEDLGAIYLRPAVGGRLELVLWGFADYGLRLAARLMPMLTGVGQPEFVIVSKRCAWEGAGGVLAMGSFDYDWNISEASFIT